MRDIEDRGRDLEHVLHQYTTLVKPAFEEFCLPVSHSIKKYLTTIKKISEYYPIEQRKTQTVKYHLIISDQEARRCNHTKRG